MKRPRLTTLKPRLSTLPSRFGPIPGDEKSRDRYRQQAQPWRKWYHTKKWQKLRARVLLRDRYTCKMAGCNRVEPNTALLVCDHVQPHKGEPVKFWDENNCQCLCKQCHDSTKASQEHSGYRKGTDINGWPIDEAHPWIVSRKARQGGGQS